ncbi:hypothetical protein ACLOJK_040639 [Asimina triloba]
MAVPLGVVVNHRHLFPRRPPCFALMTTTPSLLLPQAFLLSPPTTLGFLRRPLLSHRFSLPSNKLLLRRHFRSPTVAAASRASQISNSPQSCIDKDDDRYGKKQVISVTPPLYDYILSNVREPSFLRELREETASLRGSQMQVSPDQAQLLAMLVQIIGAQRCIEVGIYTASPRRLFTVTIVYWGKVVWAVGILVW